MHFQKNEKRFLNPPLPKDEVKTIVKSICRYPKGTSGQMTVLPSSDNYQLTDLGNAERFVDQHRGQIRYCSKWSKWIAWDGKRWTAEYKALIKRKAIETIKDLHLEAQGIEHEDDRRKQLDEVLIKQLTGEDMITARFMYNEFFEFRNIAKIIIAANHKPKITGTDYGIWRRIKLVPFQVTIPEQEQDHGLMDKLMDELSGILTWAVNGCLEWQHSKLNHPDEVTDAVKSYQLDMDSVNTFIKDCCIIDPDVKEERTVVYGNYSKWCWDNNIKPKGKRDFSDILQERGVHQIKISKWYFKGVAIRP